MLVVGDEDFALYLLSEMLEDENFHIEAVTSVDEALESEGKALIQMCSKSWELLPDWTKSCEFGEINGKGP